MAELVYAFDLKSNGEIHMGSSPISGTNKWFHEEPFICYSQEVSSKPYYISR